MTMGPDLERRSARYCAALIGLVLLSLSSIYLYYKVVDCRLVFDPYKLSVFVYENKQALTLEKTAELGRALLKEAYCRDYFNYIAQNDVYLSHQHSGIALPNLRADGVVYMLQESSELRFELWKQRPPHVVLLGSSMMFQNFNRPTFFSRYPELRLLDFSTGNNTPECAKHLLSQLADRKCEVPPGTVFFYGMNAYEMTSWYTNNGYTHTLECTEPVPGWIERQLILLEAGKKDLRSQLWNLYAKNIVSVPKTANAGFIEVPTELCNDADKLKKWLFDRQPPAKERQTQPFDEKRLAAFQWLAQWVREQKGKLVLIKVPDSSYSAHASPGVHRDFDVQIEPVVRELGLSYLALDNHEKIGVDETHFIYPGRLFNPTHLNYEGSQIFTKYMLDQVERSWIAPLLPAGAKSHGNAPPGREAF
jgi:hypothetical protein